MTVMDRAEQGALYEVTYIMNRGAGDFRWKATMVYLGRFGQDEQAFSLRPLAGTQMLRTEQIESMELVDSASEVQRKYGGARGRALPAKRGVSLGRVRKVGD